MKRKWNVNKCSIQEEKTNKQQERSHYSLERNEEKKGTRQFRYEAHATLAQYKT